ncbi:carboxypeptidase-like regulatory domain-containing protein [Candidatus Nitrosocosmicus franklandus]|uniref:Macroglobulin domain-containing protein n=1 Tax=Candidatus Nitrosocosmicus franklandianus TaxID=1798806 RepID=A0A484I9D5_9ARCH|nr:carboxypeptidase-like regulatory domain-containing protein [Candidatus Nitrosocosmicus franklandus]VFJ14381.1 exported protein of unknown function [Candidatus Nitrosocosmicus franklandus]
MNKRIVRPFLLLVLVLTTSLNMIVSDSQDASATHISKPIPYLDKNEFYSSETIDVNGWVEYNNMPASDVLVQVFLENKQDKLTSANVTSDSNGNFSTIPSIPNEIEPGNYTISVTSLCQEIHSNVCTYQWEELPIAIK